jgi:hypothetical protein
MYNTTSMICSPLPLDDEWRGRLQLARQSFEAAREFRDQTESDAGAGRLPREILAAALTHAENSESTAYAEYSRVLKLFTGLVLDGKIPNDAAA